MTKESGLGRTPFLFLTGMTGELPLAQAEFFKHPESRIGIVGGVNQLCV
jgi:hypothetical protein